MWSDDPAPCLSPGRGSTVLAQGQALGLVQAGAGRSVEVLAHHRAPVA